MSDEAERPCRRFRKGAALPGGTPCGQRESRAFVGDFGAGQALSDEQYALLVPLIPPAKPGGRPRTTDMRRLLDGLFYRNRRLNGTLRVG